MPRKIYDIKPPKTASKSGKDSKESLVITRVKRTQEAQRGRHKKDLPAGRHGKRSVLAPALICILVVVLAVGTYLFFKLPKADIDIWPKVDILTFKQTITADKSVDLVDTVKAFIPAKYLQTTKTNSQEFSATGNASNEGRATGTITVYNKYSPVMPFTLKAGTRFISDSGKLFTASQKIVVPAAKKSGSKITPGSIEVKVTAVEGGDSYNIAPANFSIPGLNGTAYYFGVYATSSAPMAGGYAGKVKKVTEDDIQGAKDVLTKKTAADAISDLKGQVPSDYILLDKVISSNITSASTQTKVGTIIENFTYQVTAKASGLAFNKVDMDRLARDYIISQIPEGKTLLDDSFKIAYSVGAVDVSGGKATLNLDFSSGIYQNIDKNSLTLSVLGENASQIKETVNNRLGEQVSKVEIIFWPFWVSSAPNKQRAVNIELKFQ